MEEAKACPAPADASKDPLDVTVDAARAAVQETKLKLAALGRQAKALAKRQQSARSILYKAQAQLRAAERARI
jgi:hypothetical protein